MIGFAMMVVIAAVPVSAATVTNASSVLVSRPVTVERWTVPPVMSGGYTDAADHAYISPRLYAALLRLVAHQRVDLRWAGWAVMTLAHECAHLAGIVSEYGAQQWGLARYGRLISLLGVHGATGRRVLREAAAAYLAVGDAYRATR